MDKVNLFIETISRRLPQKTSRSAVWALSAVFLYYQTLGKLISPPRNLRHIPRVSYFRYLMMFLVQRLPIRVINNDLLAPLLVSGPMYLRPERLGWTVHITDPEAAKQFFLKTDIYAKADVEETQKGTLFIKFLGAKNILFAHEKDEWKKHRKLVNPAFHKAKPVKVFGTLGHKVFKVIDGHNESPVNVTLLMERYTLDVIGQAGFGYDFDSILHHEDNDLVNVYNVIREAINNPTYFILPFLDLHCRWLIPSRRQAHSYAMKFHDMIYNVIEQKREKLRQQKLGNQQEDSEKDILTLMLEGELTEEGSVLTNDEIRNNLNVFFLAGHDTTANALSLAIHALARDPDLQQKARDEALRVLGDDPHDILPTAEDIKQLEFLNQVIKETMRYYGPVTTGMPRKVTQDTELNGVHLPKGTPVVLDVYGLQHNPRFWHDPETFDPSRFAYGGEADQQAAKGAAMAWSPFYNGQRMCIGMQFSLEEQRVMLSSLLRKYEWRLPDDSIHKEHLVTNNFGILTARNLDVIFKRRY